MSKAIQVKGIVPALLLIAVASVLVIRGILSLLSPDEALDQRYVLAFGTLNLKLNGSDGVSAIWTGHNLLPSDSVYGSIDLSNTGNLPGHHIDVRFENTVIEASTSPGSTSNIPMDTVLEISELSYAGTDLLPLVPDANGNGIIDLDDLEHADVEADGDDLVDLVPVPGIEGADPRPFVMTVLFHPGLASNEHMNDQVITMLTFALNTDPSQ